MLGGLVWTVSWALNVAQQDDPDPLLGLGEGNLRAFLNPAVLLIMPGVLALRSRHGGPRGTSAGAGAAAAELGLALVLAGNIVEFGLYGNQIFEREDPGFFAFTVGVIVTAYGLAVLAVGVVRAKVLQAKRSVAMALLPAAALAFPLFGLGWLFWGRVLWSATDGTPPEDAGT